MIRLRSGTDFLEISRNFASKSRLIQNVIEDCESDEVVPLDSIPIETLGKIVEYLEKDLPSNLFEGKATSSDLKKFVSHWEADFVDLPIDQIKELLLAANFLDIPQLLQLCSLKFACILYGKSASEMRVILNENDDLDPDEVNKLRKEYENILKL